MPTSRRVLPLARWSVVAIVLLMGAALVVTAWTTYEGVRDASTALIRGNAVGLGHSVGGALAASDGAPEQADLEAIMADHDELRWLAVVGPDGRLVAEVGTPTGGPIDPRAAARPPFEIVTHVPGRVRVQLRAPVAHRRREPRGQRAWQFALEFEPTQAAELRAAAARTLRIGMLAAIMLLATAGALVRWVLRREASERERERERRLASLGELSAVLAHEIRNPLASLKGNAQLLQAALPEGDKPRQKADRVVDEAIRLETLTNDLLDFVRAGELRREAVDPAALLRETAASVDAERIAVDASGAPPVWSLDGPRLRQALVNLLENAVEAGPPVKAAVRAEGGRLVFAVADAGPGVPPDEVERIFEPFYTRRTRGTGLGLAVARRVVELHGGRIEVGDAPGGGALFRVILPSG